MRIVAPEQFHNANELDAEANRDPRAMTFAEESIEIELRRVRRIWPPAVMWSLIYPLVAVRRAQRVTVLLPTDEAVRHWLMSLGLGALLEAKGVEVDPPHDGSVAQHVQVVLPLTCFRTAADAEAVTARAVESLERSGLGAANVRPKVGPIFSELALNAVQHAESPVAAYGFVQ